MYLKISAVMSRKHTFGPNNINRANVNIHERTARKNAYQTTKSFYSFSLMLNRWLLFQLKLCFFVEHGGCFKVYSSMSETPAALLWFSILVVARLRCKMIANMLVNLLSHQVSLVVTKSLVVLR